MSKDLSKKETRRILAEPLLKCVVAQVCFNLDLHQIHKTNDLVGRKLKNATKN